MRISSFLRSYKKTILLLIGILLLAYWYCLPNPLFDTPYSTVLEDRDNHLLGARIASDGQWRFPEGIAIPKRFSEAIITFEDRRFFSHWGIDLRALGRAFRQNIAAGKIVSGGSTLSMQVIRLSRKNKPRTVFQKIIEAILATRLEWRYNKESILALYAAHAPFGGNVVGLEAASWRYYGKPPQQLSWGEATTMAVLPNSPALIHPGRNRGALLLKRNRLIDRLLEQGKISTQSAELAKEEPLPDRPVALPQMAPHLLDRSILKGNKNQSQGSRLHSTIDRYLQERCNDIARQHHRELSGNGVHNLAILVLDIEQGETLAYVGNAPDAGKTHGESVDIIPASRSTGSILKPFLYAQMLNAGTILPNSLISDVPTRINGYRPENFYDAYQGVIPARKALARSLNVPFVRMLQSYGLEKFHFGLKQLGLTSINKPAEHYGLTLILGGAEASLWKITNAYTCMARSLRHFYPYEGRYDALDYRPAHFQHQEQIPVSPVAKRLNQPKHLSAAAIWQTFEAMQEVTRPNSEGDWQLFQSQKKIAWKTGTSFGYRDAWAIGIDGQYVVGIWVGNADGEGRPGLVGVKAAGPILFDVMAQLGSSEWFSEPHDELQEIAVCAESGYRALPICDADTMLVTLSGLKAAPCPYHRVLHLDPHLQYQVSDQCIDVNDMLHKPWFVLPPLEEYYYLSGTPSYVQAPPYRDDCLPTSENSSQRTMQFIYPKSFTSVYIPVDLDGNKSKVVFKVAHRRQQSTIYWHLDNEYIGQTKTFHHLELSPKSGRHMLTLVDETGGRLEQEFEVLGE